MHTPHHPSSDANPRERRETIDDLGHRKSGALQHGKRPAVGTMDREDLTNPRDGRGPLRKKDDQSNR